LSSSYSDRSFVNASNGLDQSISSDGADFQPYALHSPRLTSARLHVPLLRFSQRVDVAAGTKNAARAYLRRNLNLPMSMQIDAAMFTRNIIYESAPSHVDALPEVSE
jgi:hypothetical protein